MPSIAESSMAVHLSRLLIDGSGIRTTKMRSSWKKIYTVVVIVYLLFDEPANRLATDRLSVYSSRPTEKKMLLLWNVHYRPTVNEDGWAFVGVDALNLSSTSNSSSFNVCVLYHFGVVLFGRVDYFSCLSGTNNTTPCPSVLQCCSIGMGTRLSCDGGGF